MKRVMLYFGSFNPVHRGHIALAEYVVGQGLCDEAVLVVSPQSPYKQAAELAPEMDRFEMAEIACAASKYPERIKPSVVEFLLPKPSYTIDTLCYLKENFGSGMQFSILMGSDQIARLAGWKEYEQILEYPVYVYPRRGEPAEGFEGRITPLTDAPLQDFASTDVRDRIGRGEDVAAMLDEGVAAYIRRKGLWSSGRRSPPSPGTRRSWSSAENSITGWASGVRRSTTSTRRCVSTTRMSKPRSSPGWCRRYWNSDTKIYTTPEMTRLKIALLAGGDSPEREIALQSAAQIEAALLKEAAAIRAKLPSGAALIALCVEGEPRSSEALARQMAAWASQGVGHLVFLIGGSFGLHPSIKAEARLRLSMSPMTFPHHLARVMVLEQIYRAYQINAGTKYHK